MGRLTATDMQGDDEGIMWLGLPRRRYLCDIVAATPETAACLGPGLAHHRKALIHSEAAYELQEQVGTGTYGWVFRALLRPRGTVVAVKLIPKSTLVEVGDPERVMQEVQMQQRLRHPHVLRIWDAMETREFICIVVDYLGGKDLFDYIAQQRERVESYCADAVPEDFPQIAAHVQAEAGSGRLIRELASALAYCHRAGVAHRDLKPENVLLDANGKAMLADFGFATLVEPGRRLDTFCGSPHYAAPEVLDGLPHDGLAADVWSFGVVCYVLLCWMMPYDGDLVEIRERMKRAPPAIPKWLSPGWHDLLRVTLAWEPNDRPTMEDVLRHPLLAP